MASPLRSVLSVPENQAFSWSSGHANLSQGDACCACPADAKALSAAARTAMPADLANMSIHRDHDIGGFDYGVRVHSGLQAHLFDRLVCDRGGDGPSSNVEPDMRRDRTLVDPQYPSFENVACAQLHDDLRYIDSSITHSGRQSHFKNLV